MNPAAARTGTSWGRRATSSSSALLGIALCAASWVAPTALARDDGYEPNVLAARAEVSDMAERVLEMLAAEQPPVPDAVGWAVFSGDPISAQVPAGVGLAEHVTGESYYLVERGRACTESGRRQVLVFRDEDLFREFRQGQVSGEHLEQVRAAGDGRLMAFQFESGAPGQRRALDLSDCRFQLDQDLQRAQVAVPSETGAMMDDDEVELDDE